MLFRPRCALLSALFGGTAWVLTSCATVPPSATAAASAAANPAAVSTPVGAPASSAISATVAGTAAAPAPGARPPAAVAAPGTPRPFAEIIKDAKEQPGLFTLWTKDEKVWIEIKPDQFDQLY